MTNHKVHLQEVDKENWFECCQLELFENQKQFLESNAISIAQSKFEPTLKTYAIYLEEKIVGFAMYNSIKEELDSYWIYRIMIDKKYQRKGIGLIATKLIIDQMKKLPNCNRITVGYHHDNLTSHQFYSKLAFIDKGDRFGKEMAVVLEILENRTT